MDFKKRFNVGLTLETSAREFDRFLDEYHPFIHSFYFSPPLGSRYHTRSRVALEFLLPGKKRLFLHMLERARAYGIELELLFNTLRVDGEMVAAAHAYLAERDLSPDSVCYLLPYEADVVRVFPTQKRILSFNNGFLSPCGIDEVLDAHEGISSIVLGSLFIRNNRFFSHLAARGVAPYLLLNNACSFNCATCNNTASVCEAAFRKNLAHHSVEYLYALQSIFPSELTDGTIDVDKVALFKISNRSSPLTFLRDALDSYMTGEMDAYIKKDRKSLALWGRAGYFWPYFKKMDMARVYAYKAEILARKRGV